MCQHHKVAVLWLSIVLALAAPVSAAAPKASQPSAEPALITLQVQATPDGTIRIVATVLDARKAPVPGTPVAFKARTTFGWLDLAEVPTDAKGSAQVTTSSTFRPVEIAAEAGEGDAVVRSAKWLGGSRPVEMTVRPGRDALSRLSPQPGFISPYPVPIQVIFLVIILGGIWTTFGYLVSLLLKIRRVG